MILSILICSLEERKEYLNRLTEKLKLQNKYEDVEICVYTDNKENSIGTKRNSLLNNAKGKYVCFIDDDDMVSDNYIDLVREGCFTDKDCISLNGVITFDGQNAKQFIHSIKYNSYFEENDIYYRPPNHLNAIKKELVKDIKFEEINYGEDTDWAMKICNLGILKTEHEIQEIIYLYIFNSNK